MNPKSKEEYAIILDYLPNGYPFDPRPVHRKTPVAQAIGKSHFILLELVPKRGKNLTANQEVYMGEGKREDIHHIIGKINLDKLTQTAKLELDYVIKDLVKKNEAKFVEFFNKAGPINTRRHQIELLPGIGKKHMWEIIEKREDSAFTNFDDIKKRIKLIPDPESIIIKRIIAELKGDDKYKVFVGS